MATKTKKNSFAVIMPLLEDPDITEIMIDGTDRITIEKLGKIEDSGLRFKTDEEVKAVVKETLKMAGVEMQDEIGRAHV